VEIEAAMGLYPATVAVDDAVIRAGFGADGYGLAEKINISVALAGVGAIGYYNRISINGSINGRLNCGVFGRHEQFICMCGRTQGQTGCYRHY